mgnify:CR=1 FL=1
MAEGRREMARGEFERAARAFERACMFGPHRPEVWARYGVLPNRAYRPIRVYALQRIFFMNPLDDKTTRALHANAQKAQNRRPVPSKVSA